MCSDPSSLKLLWMTGWARTTRIEDEKKKTLWRTVEDLSEKLRILSGETKKQKENTNLKTNTMSNEKKEIWSKVLQVIITVLTAIATTFGVTSCMGM